MSIYAYTGLPGSGKSYSVVEHQILPALKSGRKVVTNVALDFPLLRDEFPAGELVEFPSEAVAANPASIYEYVSPGSVLVLDEVWRIFPAGLKANHVPEPFRKLLAEHRHMVDEKGDSCQIVLVTQDLAQISAFARQLVEQTFRTVKLTSVGLQKQYRVDVYNGPAVGPNPPDNARIRQLFGTFNSSVWRYYRSHTMRSEDSGGKVNEKAVDRRANILARPVMVLGAVAVVVFIYFGVTGLQGLFEKQKAGATVAAASAEAPATAPPREPKVVTKGSPVPAVLEQAVGAGASPAWQVVGYIENLDDQLKSVVLLSDGKRTLARPFRYCSTARGWVECSFPDLGRLSL